MQPRPPALTNRGVLAASVVATAGFTCLIIVSMRPHAPVCQPAGLPTCLRGVAEVVKGYREVDDTSHSDPIRDHELASAPTWAKRSRLAAGAARLYKAI
jgi:hypothetical protein